MELPECPVCLQVYNHQDAVPRVLACGHSACEACLAQLIHRFPNTVRCPACNQLVHYPQHQGPSALPKNIDLLSFINQQHQNPNPNSSSSSKSHKQTVSRPHFLPPFWSDDFYATWKDWILPQDAVSVEGCTGRDPISLVHGRIGSVSSSNFCIKQNQIGSLLFVGNSNVNDSVFDFSYTVRIMEALNQLKESERRELSLILKWSSRRLRVCKAYGLWMNSEDRSLFLVCERLDGRLPNQLTSLRNNEVVGGDKDEDGAIEDVKRNSRVNCGMPGFAMVGMELCEALISLHSEGLVCGCLSLSCFSFDDFGRVFVNPNEVLIMGRMLRKWILDVSRCQTSDESERETKFMDMTQVQVFVSPEFLLKLLHNEGIETTFKSSDCSVGYYSDVWALACILVSLLVGDPFVEELSKALCYLLTQVDEEKFNKLYRDWVERVSSMLDTLLGTNFLSLQQIICNCLEFDPKARSCVTDVWKCIRELLIEPNHDFHSSVDLIASMDGLVHCVTLGKLCCLPKETENQLLRKKRCDFQGREGATFYNNGEDNVEADIVEGLRLGKFESFSLEGHLDCITGLAVGGGFLFSSSFDKTVVMWSLKDLTLVQSFKGHEHRVMAVVFVDGDMPLCISADSGGGIFVWDIIISSEKEPLKKLYEPKDWRYSGIHALVAYGTKRIYTGSGDKSIKAWSLQDCTLTCTMNGHKSVVSCLEVSEGVLYSGSWDGSIRLWSLHDHSPLTILGDDVPGNVVSVLSLSVGHNMLVAAHENGSVKVWRNDVLSRSIEAGKGSILSLDVVGKWLFMGGWDKTVHVQELSGDELQLDINPVGSIACTSVITTLLYSEGKLFVGSADKIIKVYYYST